MFFRYLLIPLMLYGGYTLADAPVLQHDLSIRIDAETRSFVADARVTADSPGLPELSIDPAWEITRLGVDGRRVATPREGSGQFIEARGAASLEVAYHGVIDEDRWPYLIRLPGEGWYPDAPGYRHRFRLRLELPEGWSALTQGVPEEADGPVFTWTQDDPQRGIYLVAGPWHSYRQQQGGLRAAVLLLEDDPELAQPYLDAAIDWMGRYGDMLGDYPYHGFTLVENQAQTGWGMPGFTLLGSRVIRLPFIIHSSFPHEILHNWWGNGVFVDRSTGNWSEGLTTYLSDHLIRESRGEGRQYRLDTLSAWHDFAAAGNDFPLVRFTARHDKTTQAVGYGKGLFLFHMLRAQLGEEVFLDGLRSLYQGFRFRAAGFDDVRRVFERTCDCDLEWFFAQWLLREGAPRLVLAHAEADSGERGDSLSFTLRQSVDQPWRLRVPLRITGQDGRVLDVSVAFDEPEQSYTLDLGQPAARLEVDPDHDLFRRLDAGERPVTLSRVFAAARVAVIPADQTFVAAARAMAARQPGWRAVGMDAQADEDVLVMIGRTVPSPDHRWSPDVNRYRMDDGRIRLDGEDHIVDGEEVIALVDSVTADTGAKTVMWLAGPSGSSLVESLARLAHYGRRSYVMFGADRGSAVYVGQWRAVSENLSREFGDTMTPSN